MKQYLFRVVSTGETWKRKGEEYIEDELATEVFVEERSDGKIPDTWKTIVNCGSPYRFGSISDLCAEVRAKGKHRVILRFPGEEGPEVIQMLQGFDILVAVRGDKDFHDVQKSNTTVCVDVSGCKDVRPVVGDLRPRDMLYIDEEAEWSDRYPELVKLAGSRVNDLWHRYAWGTVGSQKRGRDEL